jgi:phospholipid/cholesterol/gamma-HCH transport system substrate-binding protein
VALAANLEAVSLELREGEGTLGKLIYDVEIYDNLKETSASLREIGDRLVNGEGTLARLLSEDDQMYQDLRDALAALKTVSQRLANGEGTLGKLTTDDALYEEAQLLMQEIRAAVDDFRETAPITSFTSIFFGAL